MQVLKPVSTELFTSYHEKGAEQWASVKGWNTSFLVKMQRVQGLTSSEVNECHVVTVILFAILCEESQE